jgi:hypothetical protein
MASPRKKHLPLLISPSALSEKKQPLLVPEEIIDGKGNVFKALAPAAVPSGAQRGSNLLIIDN